MTCFDHGAGIIGREDGLRDDVPPKVVLECDAAREPLPLKEMQRKTAEEFEAECLRLLRTDTPEMSIDPKRICPAEAAVILS